MQIFSEFCILSFQSHILENYISDTSHFDISKFKHVFYIRIQGFWQIQPGFYYQDLLIILYLTDNDGVLVQSGISIANIKSLIQRKI